MLRKLSNFKFIFALSGLTAFVLTMALPVYAQEATAKTNAIAIDTVWTLVAAFLVFFMQAGFAMVETGFTRAKNAANILMKNLMDFSVGSIAFWLVGFGIMFGADKLGLFGSNGFFLSVANPSMGALMRYLGIISPWLRWVYLSFGLDGLDLTQGALPRERI